MGVELTKNLVGELKIDEKPVEYSVSNIIMDGDTTTISHIHESVSEDIGVWSDVGHAKKALYGHLIRLSNSHKTLSKTVVDYLVKCFGYVLTQNKGNPEGICKGCKIIPSHAFGEHSACGSCCQYHKNPEKYKHQSLPYGKDLEGDDLKADLVQVKVLIKLLKFIITLIYLRSFMLIISLKQKQTRHVHCILIMFI